MANTKIRMSSQAYFDADIDVNSKKLTNLANGVNPNDAVNKSQLDALLAAQDAFIFKGVIDCSTNPNYPAADAGWEYKVSVGGKIGGASGITVSANDILQCLVDSTASGTQASVGANWVVIHTNGASGTVTSTSGSAVDNSIVRMDSTSGTVVQTSNVTIDDNGSINIPTGQTYKINGTALNADNIGDGTTNKAYTVTEKTKLSGIDSNAINTTTLMAKIVSRETPTGTKNSSNVTFTLANTPISGTEMLFVNGILMNAGAGNDYTISTATITLAVAPASTDVILCTYWK